MPRRFAVSAYALLHLAYALLVLRHQGLPTWGVLTHRTNVPLAFVEGALAACLLLAGAWPFGAGGRRFRASLLALGLLLLADQTMRLRAEDDRFHNDCDGGCGYTPPPAFHAIAGTALLGALVAAAVAVRGPGRVRDQP